MLVYLRAQQSVKQWELFISFRRRARYLLRASWASLPQSNFNPGVHRSRCWRIVRTVRPYSLKFVKCLVRILSSSSSITTMIIFVEKNVVIITNKVTEILFWCSTSRIWWRGWRSKPFAAFNMLLRRKNSRFRLCTEKKTRVLYERHRFNGYTQLKNAITF